MRDQTGAETLETFVGCRFALIGFNPEESSLIDAALSEMGNMWCFFSATQPTSPGQFDSHSAIILSLGPDLAGTEWLDAGHLGRLKAPLLVVGDYVDIINFRLAKLNAAEALIRPFSKDEFAFRVWRCIDQLRLGGAGEDTAPEPARRIVIADDDPWILAIAAETLRSRGFECFEAQNGKDALHLARTLLPDLLILDLLMPPIGGLYILKILRNDPCTSAMKVLLFTGESGPEKIMRASELGADAYVCKPLRPFDFVTHVHTLLDITEPSLPGRAAAG